MAKKKEKEMVYSGEAHAEFESLTNVFLNFAEQTLEAVRPHLQTVLVDAPPETLIRKREMVNRLNKIFDAANTAIAHPITGEPCALVVRTGKGRDAGVFSISPFEPDERGRKSDLKLEGEVKLIHYIRTRGKAFKESPQEYSRE